MLTTLPILTLISGLSFAVYGISCFVSSHMKHEFNRYGLPHLRAVVGVLQLAGAAGQLAFMIYPALAMIASGGLGLLMLAGVLVRIKIRDSFLQTSQALTYMLLNFYLFFAYYLTG
jgi:hypothetical protein